MRDMFFNYDNNISTDCQPLQNIEESKKKLESNPNLALVQDIKGNDIGICARFGTAFDLYFTLYGTIDDCSIKEFLLKSTIKFEILDYWHQQVIVLDFNTADILCTDNTIKISISEEEVKQLRQETYRMRVTLQWADGSYILYNEDNGFLAIK